MSIRAALFSDGQSRVYRWVFGQPARAFHLSELRRLAEYEGFLEVGEFTIAELFAPVEDLIVDVDRLMKT